MRQLGSDLWVTESPLRFLGLEMGARMTVIRLPDGTLLLHSPVRCSDALRRQLEPLGRVAILIAPNKLHHLFLADWVEAFPDAELYVAPGLDRKRGDLVATGILDDGPRPVWADVVDQVALKGFSFANEVVFFHKPSRTLILTDIAFNVGPESAPLTRLFFKLSGVYGRLSPTVLEKILIRDRAAFRSGLERVLAWPFERVIVSHGSVKESGGRAELERGYAWLLES